VRLKGRNVAKLSSKELELAAARAHTPESFGRALVARLAQQSAKELHEKEADEHKLELEATLRLVPNLRGGFCVWACICGRGWCECIIICVIFGDRIEVAA
jgi:hypothetical protein